MKFNETLKALRLERGILQKELAQTLHLSIGTLSNYENGVHQPDLTTLCRLADFYQVSVDYLLGRTECRQDVRILNHPLSGCFTLTDFLKLIMQLTPEERRALVFLLKRLYR